MKDKYLSNLIYNAFDFLEKAVEQFKSEPKYSVINFSAAIELILKARLMNEHWSLIISTPSNQHPNLAKFETGDFKSINFSELLQRIENVTGEIFSSELKQIFTQLAQHRNKIIHFYHEAHTKKTKEDLVKKIAVEQCIGWMYLKTQLEMWSDIFKSYNSQIQKINRKIKGHEVYFEAVFTDKQKEIRKAKKRGIKFFNCLRCKIPAAQESRITEFIWSHKCWVCELKEEFVKMPCPMEDCDGILYFSYSSNEDAFCKSCLEKVTAKEFQKYLKTEVADVFDPSNDDYTTINCGVCDSSSEVTKHSEYYICSECLYIAKEIEFCQFCGEGYIGKDLSDSGAVGCGSCKGIIGWYKND